jgi:transposase, IS5 family
MKDKNRDFDRWVSAIRAPHENVFSQQNKRTRYRGVAKNQFAAFMEATCFNLKRLAVLGPPAPIFYLGRSVSKIWECDSK